VVRVPIVVAARNRLVACGAGGGRPVTLRCRICEGAGVVEETSAARFREGARRRRERVRRGESQRERAALMGIPMECSTTLSTDGSNTDVHDARCGEQAALARM
jgi:hypothetical protein